MRVTLICRGRGQGRIIRESFKFRQWHHFADIINHVTSRLLQQSLPSQLQAVDRSMSKQSAGQCPCILYEFASDIAPITLWAKINHSLASRQRSFINHPISLRNHRWSAFYDTKNFETQSQWRAILGRTLFVCCQCF